MKPSLEPSDLSHAQSLPKEASIGDALCWYGDRYDSLLTVTDADGRFVGIVTPGDMRKAILNGKSLTTPLGQIANMNPVVLYERDLGQTEKLLASIEGLKRLYNQGNLKYAPVPILDDHGHVRGLVSLATLSKLVSDESFVVPHRNALIIGGGGYIGSVLTRQLLEAGWAVRVVDSLLYGGESLAGIESPHFEFRQANALSIDTLIQSVENIDAVIYLAELVGDPACSLAPQMALKTNYLSVTAAAHLCAYLNINRFIYTSSCSVYGASSDPDAMLTESSPTAPVSLYGKIKMLVEEAVLNISRSTNHAFAPTILRLGTVFGLSFRPRFDLVVNTFTKEAAKKKRIEVFGGNQWRPQVHVRDVARAIVKILDAPLESVGGQIFNVGSTHQNHTINELGDLVAQAFPGLEVVRKAAMVDARNYRVNCEKLRTAIGYETSMTVLQGIQEMKEAIQSGRIDDPDRPEYSNLRTLQGMDVL